MESSPTLHESLHGLRTLPSCYYAQVLPERVRESFPLFFLTLLNTCSLVNVRNLEVPHGDGYEL